MVLNDSHLLSNINENFIINMNEEKRKKYLEDIKNGLTIDQVYEFLSEFGGEPQTRGDIIVSRTICHNPPGQGSFKLYYYDNTKLFKCFTECNDTFDIFQLLLKIKHLAGDMIIYWSKQAIQTTRPWDLPDAVHYIAAFFGLEEKTEDFFEKRSELQDWDFFSKKDAKQLQKRSKQIISLKVFDGDFLKNFVQPHILPWEREGITQDIIKIHNIRYDPRNNGIIIPHYDINNNLIGIRERTLIREREKYGKYQPAIISGKMYNHPLSFNLYNINISKDNIRTIKKAIVFEGEKSCLLYGSYFGIENDISVAACGSSLINYQVELLLSLGVQEIIVAFDRQYQEQQDKEWKKWTDKLTQIYKKYCGFTQISFLFDKENLLDYKSSPIDAGPDIFLELFKNRIYL